MGAKKRYYLVVRDKKNNSFKIINIYNKQHVLCRANLLEDIDALTLNYKSREDFVNDLIKNGYIKNDWVDIFIVSPITKDSEIETLEVVYNPDKFDDYTGEEIYTRSDRLKELHKLNSSDEIKTSDASSFIIDEFSNRMYEDDELRDIVVFGFSNVGKKFAKYYDPINNKVKPGSIKYKDGLWAKGSYKLLRNVVDIMNRDDDFKLISTDTFDLAVSYFEENNPGRKAVSKTISKEVYEDVFRPGNLSRSELNSELLKVTDKNYTEGQMEINMTPKMYYEEENEQDYLITESLVVFRKLPRKIFSVDENNNLFVNPNAFLVYPSEEDKKLLLRGFNQKLMKDIDKLISIISKFNFYSNRVVSKDSLNDDIRHCHRIIYSELENDKNLLNEAYSWCKVYNRCYNYDIEYRNKLGEDNGKLYEKRPKKQPKPISEGNN